MQVDYAEGFGNDSIRSRHFVNTLTSQESTVFQDLRNWQASPVTLRRSSPPALDPPTAVAHVSNRPVP